MGLCCPSRSYGIKNQSHFDRFASSKRLLNDGDEIFQLFNIFGCKRHFRWILLFILFC